MAVKNKYLVEKLNVLNEIRANGMTLQELRFFSIYLSKINSRDISTRLVRFSLSDFQRIMEFKGHNSIESIKRITDNLLCKVVHIYNERGGYEAFQLFKCCKVYNDGEWRIEIDAHDQALALMFQFRECYFTYELWNALRLKSSNQLRMYEILKQYERIGVRIISVEKLKEFLGIAPEEYSRYGDFKTHVLDVCQKALEKNTDIKYIYEPAGKRGRGGKIIRLKFIISKNTNYKDPISLDNFIDRQKITDVSAIKVNNAAGDASVGRDELDGGHKNDGDNYFVREMYPFLSEACENEFNSLEIQVLYDLIIKVVTYKTGMGGKNSYQFEVYDYLKRKYDELSLRTSRTRIKSRFGYLKKIIEVDLKSTEHETHSL